LFHLDSSFRVQGRIRLKCLLADCLGIDRGRGSQVLKVEVEHWIKKILHEAPAVRKFKKFII